LDSADPERALGHLDRSQRTQVLSVMVDAYHEGLGRRWGVVVLER